MQLTFFINPFHCERLVIVEATNFDDITSQLIIDDGIGNVGDENVSEKEDYDCNQNTH